MNSCTSNTRTSSSHSPPMTAMPTRAATRLSQPECDPDPRREVTSAPSCNATSRSGSRCAGEPKTVPDGSLARRLARSPHRPIVLEQRPQAFGEAEEVGLVLELGVARPGQLDRFDPD